MLFIYFSKIISFVLGDQLDPSNASLFADMKCFLKTVENLEIESTDNVSEFIENFKSNNEEGKINYFD